VTAETRTWIEGLETERFGLGRFNYLPNIDAHLVKQDFEFVDESNVDGTIRILQNFACLGDFQRRHGHNSACDVSIERTCKIEIDLGEPSDDLWDIRDCVRWMTWVLSLRAVGQEHVSTDRQAAGLQNWHYDLTGGAGVRGALQDHELTKAQSRDDGFSRTTDEGKVRVAGRRQ